MADIRRSGWNENICPNKRSSPTKLLTTNLHPRIYRENQNNFITFEPSTSSSGVAGSPGAASEVVDEAESEA